MHRDVRRLLVTALPSENEENFCRLVSSLAAMLVETYTQYRSTLATLRADAATASYFESSDTVSIPIAASGKAASAASELLDDLVTAWALEWGKATNYEEVQ